MGVEGILNKGFITASADTVLNYVRTGSLWPVTFGLACCAVEMMPAGMARYALDRFGIIFLPARGARLRPCGAGRCVCTRLPADCRSLDLRPDSASGKNQAHLHHCPQLGAHHAPERFIQRGTAHLGR